jgi:hypothetical protein
MYIYDDKLFGSRSLLTKQSITSWPAQRHSHYPDRVVSGFLGRVGVNSGYGWAYEGLGQLTAEELSEKLKFLSLLPHFTVVNGKNVALTPSVMDPKIYDGPANYKVTPKLQDCLKDVMKKAKFRPIKVALVDLTKGRMQPEFAASFDHKAQVFVASVSKIATMLAAFQLRQDLRVAWNINRPKTLAELFDRVRNDWAATQRDPGGSATPFMRGVSVRGKLVLWNGAPVLLWGPKSPRLDTIFRPVLPGPPIQFSSTGENEAQLQTIAQQFNQANADFNRARDRLSEERKNGNAGRVAEATRIFQEKLQKLNQEIAKIDALGFWERMGITIGGDVPVSNYTTSTIVRDVGFPYIASTLVQSGLYDTNRGGGLWLGARYWGSSWRGPLGGGALQSGTAGSLAAFMTLLAQRRLVSPQASEVMEFFMQKIPNNRFPGTGSWFASGLRPLGPRKKVLAKVGLAAGGADDCAYIQREVDDGKGGKKTLCYVAVGLRAKRGNDLEDLIRELDKCILVNNGLTPAQGGHP